MEEYLSKSINDLNKFYNFNEEEIKILEKVDEAVNELEVSEFEYYLKREFNEEAPKIAKNFGLLKIPIKKEYGGFGMNDLISCLVKERIGQVSLSFNSFYSVITGLCATTIQRFGSEEQKNFYLKEICNGKIFAFALTEPLAGSDPTSLKTTYEKINGRFVLNGEKYLITNGTIANYVLVFAKDKKNGKISCFIVDTKQSGYKADRLKEKIGLFTSDTAVISLESVEVDKENLIGEEGKGLHIAYYALLNGRLGVASGCIGAIEACLKESIKRAKERIQHGKEIGKHQLIQKHIATIAKNLEMAKYPTYFAALKKIEYEENFNNDELRKEVDLKIALAKNIASNLAFDSADRAVQIFGGFGYSILSLPARHFCDLRVTRIYEGTDEILELKIASRILGKHFEAYK